MHAVRTHVWSHRRMRGSQGIMPSVSSVYTIHMYARTHASPYVRAMLILSPRSSTTYTAQQQMRPPRAWFHQMHAWFLLISSTRTRAIAAAMHGPCALVICLIIRLLFKPAVCFYLLTGRPLLLSSLAHSGLAHAHRDAAAEEACCSLCIATPTQ